MNNCIFTPHCIEPVCDESCPILTEVSYLLERNNLSLNNPVFRSKQSDIDNALDKLHKVAESDNRFMVISAKDTISVSNLLTYCAICENWKGNRLHCNVYNLKFSQHIEDIQRSWSMKSNSDALEYEQIWIATAKILIISSIDFVQFKDFQCQTILNLIHNRMNDGLTTIVVAPSPIRDLCGSGIFFDRMKSMFKGAIEWQ